MNFLASGINYFNIYARINCILAPIYVLMLSALVRKKKFGNHKNQGYTP